MLIEDKTLWLEALRSGKYKQTAGFLKVKREGQHFYCCLGVACEVLKDKYEIRESRSVIHFSVSQFDGSNDSLTPDLIAAFKLDVNSVTQLYTMNDLDGLSFDQIADWIEAHVQVSPEATAETANSTNGT